MSDQWSTEAGSKSVDRPIWLQVLREVAPYAILLILLGGILFYEALHGAFSAALFGIIVVLLMTVAWRQARTLVRHRVLADRVARANQDLLLFRHAMLENPEVWVTVTDSRGRITLWNKGAERISGYSQESVLGRRDIWRKLTTGAKPWMQLFDELKHVAASGATNSVLCSLYTRSGERRTVSCAASGLAESADSFVGFVLVGVDVSARQSAEEELRRMWRAIDQAVETIVVTSPGGVVLYANPAIEKMTGYTVTELVGSNVFRRGFFADTEEEVRAICGRIESGEIWTGKRTRTNRRGEQYVEETIIAPVRDATEQITAYVSTHRDVTYEHDLETQLRQAQKMEAIGTLAGGIAHDFNNVLQPIIGFTDIVLRAQPEGSKPREHLGHVMAAARRGADLAARILAFSRQRGQERSRVLLQPTITEVVKLLKGTIPSTIAIETHLSDRCGPVFADLAELRQVLMNLATNAYQAMQDAGGTLSIALEEATVPASNLPAFGNLPAGRYAVLRVADTGCGMDETVAARVFDPYFTTKTRGRGTGLGMAMVHGVVTDCGGTILVNSALGKGSTFTVYLPISAEEKVTPVEDLAHDEPLEGVERVLLADDEEAIRHLVLSALTELGYRIEVFPDGQTALDRFKHARDPFDIVVTDLTMPGLSGLELAAEITKTHPDVPVILCSGYMDVVNEDAVVKAGVKAVMSKPFTVSELAAAIRRVLGGPSGQ